MKKRYQDCNKIQKLWRSRWLLVVPFKAFWYWITAEKVTSDDTGISEKMSLSLCWDCALGMIQTEKMNFYYTMEEVQERIKKIIKKNEVDKLGGRKE